MEIENTKFIKEYINIVEILNSYAVVGMYRGEETWNEIERVMNEVPDYVLVLIDLRQANPLQYVFCQYAFGPLFQAFNNNLWQRKYTIFQMYDFHQPGFFRGVLKYLGNEYSRKESRDGFISSGMNAKLIIGDEETIDFVGKLNTNEETILKIVNENRKVTVREVVEKTNLTEEIVVDTLRSFVQKYFVIVDELDSMPHYYSFYNYLKEGEDQ